MPQIGNHIYDIIIFYIHAFKVGRLTKYILHAYVRIEYVCVSFFKDLTA